MSNELLTSFQVAEMLGVTMPHLQRMVRRGILRADPDSPSTVADRRFRVADVSALKEFQDQDLSPEAAFVQARNCITETRAMRRELDRMRVLLGFSGPSIATDRDTVVTLVLKAEDALKAPPPRDIPNLFFWARTLHSLSESHFEAIALHTNQKEPWRVFLALGRRLCDSERAVTLHDPELSHTYELLNVGLRQARRAAYFHVREVYGKERSADLFPEVKGCPHEEVIALSMNNALWRSRKD